MINVRVKPLEARKGDTSIKWLIKVASSRDKYS